jgi:hypothetical protein
MPDGHRPAISQVTGLDDQFGTHTILADSPASTRSQHDQTENTQLKPPIVVKHDVRTGLAHVPYLLVDWRAQGGNRPAMLRRRK